MKSINIKVASVVKFTSYLVLLSALVITGCTRGSNDANPNLLMAKNIISTRAQNTTHFIAIIKLKEPALLQSAQKKDGRVIIDEKLLSAITKEQAEAMEKLMELSKEVQLLFSYKMVLNAIAVLAPISLSEKIKDLGIIAYTESSGNFERPKTFTSNHLLSNSVGAPPFAERNSAKFIGAEKLNLAGIKGQGIKVGIIDTGIDYTHAMFLGEGTEEAFAAIDPDGVTAAFPNKKVVGGIDLVGTDFNSASPEFKNHIPKPDLNPIDEAGHGTHVAGTVAGIGDNVNTYNGMAPDADLYAIKVFGADGSTSDAVVIAALEYSADPNGDGANADQLDVVNLSLGSSYGNPHILYSEAIKNLVNGGTVVVASAGNSGHRDYIVGAPGTSDAAISVAASVDNGDHLWKFSASRFNLGTAGNLLVEAIEAATTKKIADAGEITGKIVFIGNAATDLSEEQKAAVKGNIALIDRGVVNFNDKIKR
ncbi:MAG: S8 family serine peptidase, partial [Bdellovibrionota bacterium]